MIADAAAQAARWDSRGDADVVGQVVRALADPEPLVRGHAAWALGRTGTAQARAALIARDCGEERLRPE